VGAGKRRKRPLLLVIAIPTRREFSDGIAN